MFNLVYIFLNKIYIFQDVVFALLGFLLFLGFGSKLAHDVNYAGYFKPQKGLAAMSIITSLVYLVDLVFGLINLKNNS